MHSNHSTRKGSTKGFTPQEQSFSESNGFARINPDSKTHSFMNHRPPSASENAELHSGIPADRNFGSEDTFPGGKYFGLKFHSSNGALDVKPSITKGGINTLLLEFAGVVKKGEKNYNWNEKIVFQITKTDIQKFLMVMLGISTKAKFQHYGAANDKSLNIALQKNNFGVSLFMQASQGKKNCSMPVSITDTTMIGHLGLAQYIKNFEGLSTETVLMTLNRIARLEGISTI